MIYKEEVMRDCEKCVYARPYGGENDNRCTAWDCEYISRKDAIAIYKAHRDGILVIKDMIGSAEIKGE